MKILNEIHQGLKRLSQSAVVWAWAFNGFRLASGILLLPLLLNVLTEPDLGMYYIFLSLTAILPIIDASFSLNIGRYASYAMGGALELQASGIDHSKNQGQPNFPLLWNLLEATRKLYRYIAVATLILLGAIGTVMVELRIHETSDPQLTWIAWGITLLAAGIEIYAGWWSVFLRGMNFVLPSTRLAVLAYAGKLLLAALLLLAGAGLLSVPLASLVSSYWHRTLARRLCLKVLPPSSREATPANPQILIAIIWPNSWRVGLMLLSFFVCSLGLAFLCLKFFGLSGNAQYGLCLQIVTIIHGMANVWTSVKWPLVGQFQARRDLAQVRRILWPRIWLQNLTYLSLTLAALALAQPLLDWWNTDKRVLPTGWFALLALNTFLEMQYAIWANVIMTQNRLPNLWAAVVANIVAVLIALVFVYSTPFGIGSLVLGPLLAHGVFNYWYWPREGARKLQTGWIGFTFSRPA